MPLDKQSHHLMITVCTYCYMGMCFSKKLVDFCIGTDCNGCSLKSHVQEWGKTNLKVKQNKNVA